VSDPTVFDEDRGVDHALYSQSANAHGVLAQLRDVAELGALMAVLRFVDDEIHDRVEH